MRSAIKTTSIVGALGAGALALSLAGVGPGVGAQFADSATANASIDVGTFSCTLSSSDPDVTISADGHTATVALGTITSSAPGRESAPVTVTNTGSMPLKVSWTESTTGNILGGSGAISALAAADDAALAPDAAQDVSIGFAWDELDNHDLGRSGTARYTASCAELPAPPEGMSLFGQASGTALWDGAQAVLHLPGGTTAPTAAGVTLLDVGPDLPAAAPVFTTDSYAAGSPRMVIKFSDGSHVYGYPSQANPSNSWELPGSGAPKVWSDVQSYATDNSLTVTGAYIVLDTSRPTPVDSNITCVDYSGTPLFGTC